MVLSLWRAHRGSRGSLCRLVVVVSVEGGRSLVTTSRAVAVLFVDSRGFAWIRPSCFPGGLRRTFFCCFCCLRLFVYVATYFPSNPCLLELSAFKKVITVKDTISYILAE